MENKSMALLPSADELVKIKDIARMAVLSGMVPIAIDTPEKAAIIILKGRELGLMPMVAFSHINVINGKPCCSAELMLASIRKDFPEAEIKFEKADSKECILRARRNRSDELETFSMTYDEAERAGFVKAWDKEKREWYVKDNWRKQSKTMLRWRMISEMKRFMFPEVLMGLDYIPDELESVDNSNERDVTPQSPPPSGVADAQGLPIKEVKVADCGVAQPESPAPVRERPAGTPFVRSAKDPKPEEKPVEKPKAVKSSPPPDKLKAEREKLINDLKDIHQQMKISYEDFMKLVAKITPKKPPELTNKEIEELCAELRSMFINTEGDEANV